MLKSVKTKEQAGDPGSFKAEVESEFSGVLSECAPELQKAQDARASINTAVKALSDAEHKLESSEQEANSLRGQISLQISAGQDVDGLIRKRSGILNEATVLEDLIDDLKGKIIPELEKAAEASQEAFQEKMLNQFVDLRDKYFKGTIHDLTREMAGVIKTYNNCLDTFIEVHTEVNLANRPSLRFPMLSAQARPQDVLTMLDQGII